MVKRRLPSLAGEQRKPLPVTHDRQSQGDSRNTQLTWRPGPGVYRKRDVSLWDSHLTMETRQQESWECWGSVGPEEWVNSAQQGLTKRMTAPSGEEVTSRCSDYDETFPNGNSYGAEHGKTSLHPWGGASVCHSDDLASWTDRGHLSGFLDSDPLREADEHAAASDVNLTEEERDEIQRELAKLEEEISTLRQVLASKEKQHAELKHKLGITPLSEIRNNFTRGWQDVQSSTAYKRTSETLSSAGQKTSAAFSTLGSAINRKFGDMSHSITHSVSMPAMRNSPSFKSFEEKVESTVSTIKTKVGGSGTGGSFEDVLSSAAKASSKDTPTNNLMDTPERPQ
ncbi:tumor protein D53 isoform X2 [Dunckerocampus dactyliophorus]|uniref:tumor protein D53 isoform X2 n=1 Tax=Dunckerocampus dactyliophorus TaxID=161453 RepID=UPI002406FF08|nr:tumor protein D53 isoform X2 [Dunckerocampus dactyliophorus]